MRRHKSNCANCGGKSTSVWCWCDGLSWLLLLQDSIGVRRLPVFDADVHHVVVLRHCRAAHRRRHLQVHRVQRVRIFADNDTLCSSQRRLQLISFYRMTRPCTPHTAAGYTLRLVVKLQKNKISVVLHSLSIFFPFSLLPLSSPLSCPWKPARGSGELCKRFQWGPGRKRI